MSCSRDRHLIPNEDVQNRDYFDVDPALVVIVCVVIGGVLCFLGGVLLLLCVVSEYIAEQLIEGLILIGTGFVIVTVCAVAWRLTAYEENLPNSQKTDTTNQQNSIKVDDKPIPPKFDYIECSKIAYLV